MKKSMLFLGKRSLAFMLALTLAAGTMTGCGASKTDRSGTQADTGTADGAEYGKNAVVSEDACAAEAPAESGATAAENYDGAVADSG